MVKKGVSRAPATLPSPGLGAWATRSCPSPWWASPTPTTPWCPGTFIWTGWPSWPPTECARGPGPLPWSSTPSAFATAWPWATRGMHASLPSREVVADSVELMALAHGFDALVLIASCDKIVPGMLMAAARLNLPTVMLTGGPMATGKHEDGLVDLISVFEGVAPGAGPATGASSSSPRWSAPPVPAPGSCSGHVHGQHHGLPVRGPGPLPARRGRRPGPEPQAGRTGQGQRRGRGWR